MALNVKLTFEVDNLNLFLAEILNKNFEFKKQLRKQVYDLFLWFMKNKSFSSFSRLFFFFDKIPSQCL